MNQEKFDYYYNKVMDLRTTRNISSSKLNKLFPWEKDAIKSGLKNIINNNYEHLLTDSFLDYMSNNSTIGFKYVELSEDENSILFLLTYYFQSIVGQYAFTPNNKDSKFGFVNLLEGEVKEATHDAYNYKEISTEYRLDEVLLAVLAYCYMNKCICNYKSYCEKIMNNQMELLDYMDLNKIMDGPKDWYTFINNYINNHFNTKKKVIR